MFPLSPWQQIVWLHEQLRPGGAEYHFTARLDIVGRLNEAALVAATEAVAAQHDILRTALVAGTDPQQAVATSFSLRWRSIDWRDRPCDGPEWEQLLRTQIEEPFDLYRPPLVRWTLVRTGDATYRLLHTEHHLIHDGRSFAILLRDLFLAYGALVEGRPPRLPVAPTYEEYVRWLAEPPQREAMAEALAGWRERLADAPPATTVPGGRRRPAKKRFVGAQWEHRIAPELAARVRIAARRRKVTPFSLLLDTFCEVLRRYTGESELLLGTAVGNRRAEFDDTVGMFVNSLPLRVPAPPPDWTVGELGSSAAAALFTALDLQEAPIQEITRVAGASAAGLDNPLFRIMFSAHDTPLPDIDMPGLQVTVAQGLNLARSRMDIDVVVIPDDRRTTSAGSTGESGMTLLWDYDTDQYDASYIARIAGRFTGLLDAIVTAAPDTPIRYLAMRDTGGEPSGSSIGVGAPSLSREEDLFARYAAVADQYAEKAAVLAGPDAVTHRELVGRARRLAAHLSAAGVGAGSRIAVVLSRSPDAVVAFLACLRVRAAFCPLSPADPADRLLALLRRLAPAVVLTDATRLATCRGSGVAAATEADAAQLPQVRSVPPARDDVAYVMHTSGSTGIPKAAMITRSALANHADAFLAELQLGADDRVLQFAQPSFDVAIEEILPTLLAGASLVIPQSAVPSGAELAALLTSRRVTVVNLPTSYAAVVLPEIEAALPGHQTSVRLLVLGGERVSGSLAHRLAAALGRPEVRNGYGLTEATITSAMYRHSGGSDDELPIGRPLAGVELYVLDANRQPLSDLIVGEIAVGGTGLALGYLGDREQTDDRFVHLPNPAGKRVYLTGDLGYWRSDGQLCFLGRRDNQIKLHGNRIELEEVEAAAEDVVHGARRAVVLDETSRYAPRLVAFVETTKPLDGVVLTAALARRVPRVMLPSRWLAVPHLPSLTNGKPDRRALARMVMELPETPAPMTPTKPDDGLLGHIRSVWADVTGRDDLDAESDFFQVGGHSLLAMQITARLRDSLDHDVPLALLFEEPVLLGYVRTLRGLLPPQALARLRHDELRRFDHV